MKEYLINNLIVSAIGFAFSLLIIGGYVFYKEFIFNSFDETFD